VSRAGHRAPARTLGRWGLPGALAFFCWLADNTPGSVAGFLGFIALGVLISLFYPLAVLLAAEAPGALVPWQWRAWYRQGQEHRPAVRKRLRRVVYAADRNACCYCRSSAGLQLDHYRPWSLGGRTSYWNSFTLCGPCNRVKSNYWVHRSGRVTYRSFDGWHRPVQAAAILAFERRYRWSLMRFVRAATAL
jgi:HNH endonuclease